MAEDNNVKRIKRWKPMSKRPTGRPILRWEDDVLRVSQEECARLRKGVPYVKVY